jgi:hypothetical protein
MNVRWSVGDETVISAGGNDKCLFQWKYTMGESDGKGGEENDRGSFVDEGNASLDSGDNNDLPSPPPYVLMAPTGGDEGGCVKPWLGEV